MKNCYKLLVICCLMTSACFAEENEPENTPNISVMITENIEKADILLRALDLELSRYLGGRNAYLEITKEYLKKGGGWEKELKKNKELQKEVVTGWEKELKRNKELQKKVIAERKKFLAFRENTAKISSLHFGFNGDYFSSLAKLEMTKWYVNYMRKMLFPSHLPPEEQNES